ncbi:MULTISPECIES: hypothetical protein [unclassified Nocardia]
MTGDLTGTSHTDTSGALGGTAQGAVTTAADTWSSVDVSSAFGSGLHGSALGGGDASLFGESSTVAETGVDTHTDGLFH